MRTRRHLDRSGPFTRRSLLRVALGAGAGSLLFSTWRADQSAPRAFGAPGAPVGATPPQLQQLLTRVPPRPLLRLGRSGVTFVDTVRQRHLNGFGAVDSFAAAAALPEQEQRRFFQQFGPIPPSVGGPGLTSVESWRETFGYDIWQMERAIWDDTPPYPWSWVAGRFDVAAVEAALQNQGYTATTVGEQRVWSLGEDGAFPPNRVVAVLARSRMNRVAVSEQGLLTATSTELAAAILNAHVGGGSSLGDAADLAALAQALGSVTGAAIVPVAGSEFASTDEVRRPNREPYPVPLHPYRIAGVAVRDEAPPQTTLIAVVYEHAEAAAADAPLVRERVADYPWGSEQTPLGQLLTVGDPTLEPIGEHAVVMVPLIGGGASLWRQLGQLGIPFLELA